LKKDSKFTFIAVYKTGRSWSCNPSKWITEIYIPLLPKVVTAGNTIPTTAVINRYQSLPLNPTAAKVAVLKRDKS
jgi:hypothetical protein